MSYLALYRRFRPQTFEDLIGQEVVVKALVNQIKTDKVGHAYLFCGARGTGKTTVAKIFARAINCERKNGSPCGECDTCKKLEDPSNLDIVEMDAASNNKVENVREIRDKVQYPPVSGRYKVYIIDEVHMLTTEAFNALLKTLEEPPKHAVFILATTEPHKLPQTILSRCMRFDFKLVPVEMIARLISGIFDKVGKEYEPEAVKAIARSGEGSVRDALSIADICVSFSDGKLTYDDVCEVLGATDKRLIAELCKYMLACDTGNGLKATDNLLNLGKNVALLTRDVLSYLRELLVAKSCTNAGDVLALPENEIAELKQVAAVSDTHRLLRCVEIFSEVENDLKYSTHPRIIFETAICKASQSKEDYNIDALISRISALENKLAELSVLQSAKSQTESKIVGVAASPISEAVKKDEQTVSTPSVETVEKRTENIDRTPASSKADGAKASADLDRIGKAEVKEAETPVTEPAKPVQDNNAEPIRGAVSSPKTVINERRIWGNIIRRLRETNKMLWAACQELDTEIKNGKLIIKAQDASELKMLKKQENLEVLNAVLQEFAPYSVEVVSFDGSVIKQEGEDLSRLQDNFAPVTIEE
ncbi:MAG: DNA polymerase III subunit gamma/tau [Christensenellaceae bacterium]